MPDQTPPTARFTVVLVHRNGAAMLLDALAALGAAITEADEVVLVDNASTDDSLARVRAAHPRVRIVANPCNRGFARACNQGLAQGRGRFLLLLNNDTRVPADLLDRLERDFASDPRAGLIGAQLIGADGTLQRTHGVAPRAWDEWAPRPWRRRPTRLPGHGISAVPALVGACLAVRREALEQAGPLDPDFFFYYEDLEWSHRVGASGWAVLLDQDLRVVHLRGGSTSKVRRGAQLERFRSRLIYYRKVFSPWEARALTAFRLARLALDLVADGLLAVASLGRAHGPRLRLAVHVHIVRWLLAGRPAAWGLPDKCPEAAA